MKLADAASEAAAAFRLNYMTAYYALQRRRLRASDTLLVHGAAGGVGLATVDMGLGVLLNMYTEAEMELSPRCWTTCDHRLGPPTDVVQT